MRHYHDPRDVPGTVGLPAAAIRPGLAVFAVGVAFLLSTTMFPSLVISAGAFPRSFR
jgi:hypothetical protein